MADSQPSPLKDTDRSSSTADASPVPDRDPGSPEIRLDEIEKQARLVREATSDREARLELKAIRESVQEVRDRLGIEEADDD